MYEGTVTERLLLRDVALPLRYSAETRVPTCCKDTKEVEREEGEGGLGGKVTETMHLSTALRTVKQISAALRLRVGLESDWIRTFVQQVHAGLDERSRFHSDQRSWSSIESEGSELYSIRRVAVVLDQRCRSCIASEGLEPYWIRGIGAVMFDQTSRSRIGSESLEPYWIRGRGVGWNQKWNKVRVVLQVW